MANYFSIVLTVLTVLTGILWALDAWKLKPKRQQRSAQNNEPETAQPWWAEYSQSIFPIIAAVLILRSFLYEPFQIPSGSMMPTLLRGDFILVEKFSYGLRDPVARKEMVATGLPKRGDVAVFKFPPEPNIDYIKRVVGLPGDRIIYRNKTLYLEPACTGESQECPKLSVIERDEMGKAEFFRGPYPLNRYSEILGDKLHDILIDPSDSANPLQYYQQEGTAVDEWIVPEGQYFMMGDNRDNSQDSRYWGFVDQDLLVGKAVFIWMSFEMDRDRSSWLPGWVPTGVRWSRLGSIE